MVGIEDIAVYIPPARISNFDRKAQFQFDDQFIEEKLGVAQVAVKGEGEQTSDMGVAAFQALVQKSGLDPARVECLFVVTQNPDLNLPHTSAMMHGKLDLHACCACFDISLGCSGFVYGLAVIESFMERHALRCGVLVTADPYSVVVDPNDKNTAALFGDAATATLLGRHPRFTSGKFTFGTYGKGYEELICRNHTLHMNGRGVFDFAVRRVPEDVRALLKHNGLQEEEVDKFLFHQGSKFMVRTIVNQLKLDPAKAPFDVREYGNTVSSSIPILLEKELENEAVKTLVICGFGVGLSWASGMLFRVP